MTVRTDQPPSGVWAVHPPTTKAELVVRHFAEKVRAGFAGIEGTIEIGEDPLSSTVEGFVEVASFVSGSDERDEHVRGPLLKSLHHPTIHLVSTGIRSVASDRYEMDTMLTVRDVSRPVQFTLGFLGWKVVEKGDTRAWFYAEAVIDRTDFDVGWNRLIEMPRTVGRNVKLELRVEARLAQAS